jgi:hypothetical protein
VSIGSGNDLISRLPLLIPTSHLRETRRTGRFHQERSKIDLEIRRTRNFELNAKVCLSQQFTLQFQFQVSSWSLGNPSPQTPVLRLPPLFHTPPRL